MFREILKLGVFNVTKLHLVSHYSPKIILWKLIQITSSILLLECFPPMRKRNTAPSNIQKIAYADKELKVQGMME